jgi:MraZ protein
MFLGEFLHSLDPKGRLILPARFRDLLSQAYVTSEMDGCLALWAPTEFQARAAEMKNLAKGTPVERSMSRVFFAGAQEASPDRQGRIAIPGSLRQFAGLSEERQVVVTGAWDHVEIWDVEVWERAKGAGESALHGPEGLATVASGTTGQAEEQ